jgi:RNA-binding protein YhbY
MVKVLSIFIGQAGSRMGITDGCEQLLVSEGLVKFLLNMTNTSSIQELAKILCKENYAKQNTK